MWPKALTQLVELAPHVTRLLPLADRYFKEKSAGDDGVRQALEGHRSLLEGQRAAVVDLGDRLRAEMGSVTSAQAAQSATLQRQIADVEKHLGSARADAVAAKQAAESMEGRIRRIEDGQRSLRTLLIVAVALLVILVCFVVISVLRGR